MRTTEIISTGKIQASLGDWWGLGPAQHSYSGEAGNMEVSLLAQYKVLEVTCSSAGYSGSVKDMPITCLYAQLWSRLPEEGRHALAKSAQYTHPSLAVCAPRGTGQALFLWLSSSSEKQPGLRRALGQWSFLPVCTQWLLLSVWSFEMLKNTRSPDHCHQGKDRKRMGLIFEDRERRLLRNSDFWGTLEPEAWPGRVPGQPVTATHETQAYYPGSTGHSTEDIDNR